MSRQQQISNQIITVKHEIDSIDAQIHNETQKQKLIDQLMMDLNFSSSHESLSQSAVNSDLKNSSISVINDLSKSKSHQYDFLEDNSSILTEDLSFQIQKIKIFQNNRKNKDKNMQGQNNAQNIIRLKPQGKGFQLKNFIRDLSQNKKIEQNQFLKNKTLEDHKYLLKFPTQPPLKELPQDFSQENSSQNQLQIDLIQKAIQTQHQKQLKKQIQLMKIQQNKIKRIEKLFEQKRLMRQKIIAQKRKEQQNLILNVTKYVEKAKHERIINQLQQNLTKQNDFLLANNSLSNRKRIFTNLPYYQQPNLNIEQTIKYDVTHHNNKAFKFTKYIDKRLNSLSKTQQKITSCKQWLKSTHKKPYQYC